MRRAESELDLNSVHAVGLDEMASRSRLRHRVHRHGPCRQAGDLRHPGKGKACVAEFRTFLLSHGVEATRLAEVVCAMSPAFVAAVAQGFPNASVTVDYTHLEA